MKEQLLETVKEVLSEATKVNFKGHKFVLRVDVNEDPNKKGIKVQFLPTTFGAMSPQEQNDVAIALGDKLDSGLNRFASLRAALAVFARSRPTDCSRASRVLWCHSGW